jgi:hypothetical protein
VILSIYSKGDTIIFAAFGGGFTWDILLKWAYDKNNKTKNKHGFKRNSKSYQVCSKFRLP